jgi:hypothetical protein
VAEGHGALGHRVQVAGEAQVAQRVEEGAVEASRRRQPGQVVVGEAQRQQVLDDLLQAGGNSRTNISNTAVPFMPPARYACSMASSYRSVSSGSSLESRSGIGVAPVVQAP